MYLLDTDVCIGILRGTTAEAYEWFMRTSTSEVMLPAMVEAELRLGALKGKNARNSQIVEDFLDPFTIVPFDSNCAKQYAKIRASLEETGRRIGPNDMIIAATALAHNASIVTNNVREYKRVPELKVVTFSLETLD